MKHAKFLSNYSREWQHEGKHWFRLRAGTLVDDVLTAFDQTRRKVIRAEEQETNQHFQILIRSGNSRWRATSWKCHCIFHLLFTYLFILAKQNVSGCHSNAPDLLTTRMQNSDVSISKRYIFLEDRVMSDLGFKIFKTIY